MRQASYNRVLLKVSGESLKGSGHYGIDPDSVTYLAQQISDAHSMGVETFGVERQPKNREWTGRPPTMPECLLR